tara:strand:+ start:1564 stop:3234 length:1671 start_codon:yes stop_codon:yes gene_type:complete
MKKIILFGFIITLISFSFSFGIFFENKKFFPYFELAETYVQLRESIRKKFSTTQKNIVKEKEEKEFKKSSLANFQVDSKNLETAISSIKIDYYNLNKLFGNSQTTIRRGGICTNDNFLVLLTSAGEGIILDLKNNEIIKKYSLKDIDKDIFSNLNIVQDIECKDSTLLLEFLISFEEKITPVEIKPNHVGNFQSKIVSVRFDTKNDNFYSKQIYKSTPHVVNWSGRIHSYNDKILRVFSSKSSDYENQLDVPMAMDPDLLEGKIIEIDPKTNTKKIFSMGHRNPQGLYIDQNNIIFSTEHGARGGDELNIIEKGKNYGWPLVSHGTSYYSFSSDSLEKKDGKPKYSLNTLSGSHEGFEKPKFSWSPGIGISNLLKIKYFNKSWQNDLIISSLKNRSIYRLRFEEDSVKTAERIWIGKRIRDIVESKDGNLYLWTDDLNLVKIFEFSSDKISGSWDRRYLSQCLSCHYLDSGGIPNDYVTAPTLSRIFSRDIASDENYKYSKALQSIDGNWNKFKLVRYLLDPQKFAPGTNKNYKIQDTKIAYRIVENLEKLDALGE